MKFALASVLFICSLIPSATLAQDVLIAVKKDGKWGYVDAAGASIIAPHFDEAYSFSAGKAVAIENNQYGIIDAKGKWLAGPRKGESLSEITSNRLVCSDEKGKWGAINSKGAIAVPFNNDIMSAYQGHLAIAGAKTSAPDLYRVAVLDTAGKMVVNFDNTYLPGKSIKAGKKVREGYVSVLVDGDFSSSLIASAEKLDGKTLYYALLDVKNKRLVSLKVSSLAAEVTEGRFNMVIDGIAYSWSQPLPAEPVPSEAKFSYLTPAIFPFSGGIAAVQKDGKWAYIDKDGSLISESNLTAADFSNEKPLYMGGFVIFWKKNGEGIYVDLKGNQRVPMEFEELQPFQSGAAVVKYKGKYGLVHKDGSWVLPAEYEGIRY
jgi:hypothetical protein